MRGTKKRYTTMSEQGSPNSNWYQTKQDLSEHGADGVTHVSSNERKDWNAKATTAQVNTAKSEAITAAATDATSKANTAKAAAIETAAADATAKANTAKTDAIASAASSLKAHADNTSIHVTASERTNWNLAKTHIDDTTKHITSSERTSWNNKADAHSHPYDAAGAASGVQSNLNSHVANTSLHVTSAEKAAWNSKLSGMLFPDYANAIDVSSQYNANGYIVPWDCWATVGVNADPDHLFINGTWIESSGASAGTASFYLLKAGDKIEVKDTLSSSGNKSSIRSLHLIPFR